MGQVAVGKVSCGGGASLALIAGPCVIESADHTLRMARLLASLCEARGVPLVFKASFDKANRSGVSSYRGPGLEEGLSILAEVKRESGLPVLTDIHLPEQAAPAAEVVDCLQIPAFLCRQTDLLLEAGRTGKPVNVKKGQFMAPWDMANVAGKVRSTGNEQVMLTERGASLGYNNLVVDMRSFAIMAETGAPVIFDATHSVQKPGGKGTSSGGDRMLAPVLARAAVAAGVDGLFLEVHDRPDNALCDGDNMLDLDQLDALLNQVTAIDRIVRPGL